MDRIENENFFQSVFKNKRMAFWYKRESWKYATKILGYKIDAWHLFKSEMVILFFLAIVFYKPFVPVLDFLILGLIWNVTFNIFYNHIFKSN